MNKFGYQPMPVLLRSEPSDARQPSKSAKILRVVATLGTLLTLCGAVAICLIGFHAFPRKTLESKVPVNVPVFPETKVSPAADANEEHSAGVVLPDLNPPQPSAVTEDRSMIDQTTTPAQNPPSIAAPLPAVSDNELLKGDRPDAGRASLARHLSEAARKTLEKGRRQAERERSRLEALYQKHAISSEAYSKGEEKYRREIERYRREMSAHSEPKNVAGQN